MTAALHVGRAVLLVAVAVLAGIGAADIINQAMRGGHGTARPPRRPNAVHALGE